MRTSLLGLGISLLLTGMLLWMWVFPAGVSAQVDNGIVEPAPGDVLSGIVIVRGTAIDPSFLRYELAFQQRSRPGAEWIVFAQGDRPVIDGTLAVWDTTVGREASPVFPDGPYQLRLRVVRADYNYDEYFLSNLIIANDNTTPSPTPTITTTVELGTATPQPGAALGAAIQTESEVLPSLTPFPTPSPQATPVNAPLGPAATEDEPETQQREGLLERLAGVDVSRFGQAFWQGVTLVAYAFGALALYLLLRGILRRLWRLLQTRLLR